MRELEKSSDAECKRLHDVLVLFAFETFSTFRANSELYGELNEAQERKLRQLSIVSLCARNQEIPYATLKEELQVFDERDLEDLLMDTIYSGLIGGKLDSKSESLRVEFAIGRDIQDSTLGEMNRILGEWASRAQVLISAIHEQVNHARGELQQDAMRRGEFKTRVAELSEKLSKLKPNFADSDHGGERGGGGGMGMRPRRGGPGRKRHTEHSE